MGATLRPLVNLLAVALALLLLGVLLLVSSGGDDGRQRLLDHGLRELRELGTAMQSEVVTADGLELDVSDRFHALELAFDATTTQLVRQQRALEAQSISVLSWARATAFELFNTIDVRSRQRISPDELVERLHELLGAADTLRQDAAAFTRAQERYLAEQDEIQERGRELVRQLRQRGYEAAADTAFAGLQQSLDRVRSTIAENTTAVDATLQRLRDVAVPAEALDDELDALTDEVAALLARRLAVNAHLARVTASAFPELTETLRESVTADHLYTLQTVSDARILLNVYTLLMLLILVYFGVRLQMSHRTLNRSHTLLEERVKERTRELETAYDDLKESQVQLVQAEKMSSLGQLVAGVVHEINTPLLYVMNNTDMTHETILDVQRDLEPLRELVRCLKQPELPRDQIKGLLEDLRSRLDVDALDDNLDEIASLTADSREGLGDIDALVKSLKDFSRLDRATYDRFDVRDGLEKTLLITKNLLKYGIEVERDFRTVPEILCAPSRVNQVFINLITNAAQAMDGQGTLKISAYGDDDGWVHVEIRDTGCGIPEEHLDKVMDPFFTTKPVGQGTGLGLSIVRKIMDEHHGRLLIDSKVDVGTQVTLSFPVDGASGEGEPIPESASDSEDTRHDKDAMRAA
jgi:signal transduction histidine kinase